MKSVSVSVIRPSGNTNINLPAVLSYTHGEFNVPFSSSPEKDRTASNKSSKSGFSQVLPYVPVHAGGRGKRSPGKLKGKGRATLEVRCVACCGFHSFPSVAIQGHLCVACTFGRCVRVHAFLAARKVACAVLHASTPPPAPPQSRVFLWLFFLPSLKNVFVLLGQTPWAAHTWAHTSL